MYFGLISILMWFLLGQSNSFDTQLKKYLDEKFSGYIKYEYQVSGMPQKYSNVEIDNEKNATVSKNYIYVPVKVYDDKKIVSSSMITIKVKLFKNVFVARKEIRRGENLEPNYFQLKDVDVAPNSDKIFDLVDELVKYRSKVMIKDGAVLSEEMVEPIPVVKKGDNLILHTAGSGVDISQEVIARQDGCIGDVISVHAKMNRLYKAKIVDKKNLILVE
jgi:flagella basal body P-ring formation protein FlgA